MQSVILKFREYLPQSSSTERGAIEYLMQRPEEVATMSIREFSQNAFASPSTITRLCRKLGYAKYRDFQQALMYENALKKETIRFLKVSCLWKIQSVLLNWKCWIRV